VVTIEDLKEIVIMTHLEEDMLTRLCSVVDRLSFHDQEVIFRQGDVADRFYMVKRGKVLLEQNMSDLVTVSVGSIKPGYSFGWSTMIEEGVYTTDAVCTEPCEIFSIRGSQLRNMCAEDPRMGYILVKRLLIILKKRYENRTDQFLKVIQHHPDMKGLFRIE
jgi:CRP-like cAMP-binding protein